MQKILPPELALTQTPLTWRGTLHMWFTASAGFALNPPANAQPVATVPASEAWAAAMAAIAPGTNVDMGMPKLSGEWLLAGKAFAPNKKAVTGLTVSMQIGDMVRDFLVSGERKAGDTPAPFVSMPLDWAHAAGSPLSPFNPLGCGTVPDKKTGILSLPCISDVRTGPVLIAGDKTPPVCPLPLGAWPCRMGTMGTYDKQWFIKRWPGLPDDFDWSFFNLAQVPQRLPNKGFFMGGEHIRLTNLHPTEPVLEGTIPNIRLRFFADKNSDPAHVAAAFCAPKWEEMPARCDTVWLFPEQGLGLLLWHMACPTKDEAGSDISQVKAVFEDAGKSPQAAASLLVPQPPETPALVRGDSADPKDFFEILTTGLAASHMSDPHTATAHVPPSVPDTAALHMPNDPSVAAKPQLPSSPLNQLGFASREEYIAELHKTLAESIGNFNEALAGLNMEALTEKNLEAISRCIETHVDSMSTACTLLETELPPIDVLLTQGGVQPEALAKFNAMRELEPPLADNFSDQNSYAAAVQGYVQQIQHIGGLTDSLISSLTDALLLQGPTPPALGQTRLGEMLIKKNPLIATLFPSFMDTSVTPHNDASTVLQIFKACGLPEGQGEQILAALELPVPSPDDFSTVGEYQKALEAHSTVMEQACGFGAGSMSKLLVKQHALFAQMGLLDPAQPLGTPQAHKSSKEVRAEATNENRPPKTAPEVFSTVAADAAAATIHTAPAASFDVAEEAAAPQSALSPILTREDVEQALATGRPLKGEDLSGLDLSGLSFAGGDLSQADCTGVNFTGCDLRKTRAHDTTFDQANLTACLATDMMGTNACFHGANLAGSDFSTATLDKASFDKTNLTGTLFTKALLTNASFTDCLASAANFSGAQLQESRVMGKTDFSSALFIGADLSAASWEDVQGTGLNATASKAVDARFENCNFTQSQWAHASMQHTTFAGSTLHQANLAWVNLLQGSLRGARLGGATLENSNLYGADMYLAAIDSQSSLTSANLNATCLRTAWLS